MSTQEKDILTIMKAIAELHQCESVWWRTDAPHFDPITFLVSCNDVFCWGCSDAEELTIENLPVFIQACKEAESYGPELFVARVRGLRPQGAYYKCFTPELAALFDAAGPPREVNLVNPQPNTPGRPE